MPDEAVVRAAGFIMSFCSAVHNGVVRGRSVLCVPYLCEGTAFQVLPVRQSTVQRAEAAQQCSYGVCGAHVRAGL